MMSHSQKGYLQFVAIALCYVIVGTVKSRKTLSIHTQFPKSKGNSSKLVHTFPLLRTKDKLTVVEMFTHDDANQDAFNSSSYGRHRRLSYRRPQNKQQLISFAV